MGFFEGCWSCYETEGSGVNIMNEMNPPTIISLQDTVDLIKKKYGEDWRTKPECKCVVIWSSRLFIPEHVKEAVPDLFDLCEEYRIKGTVNGNQMPENMFMLAFAIIDPNYDI